MRTNGQTDMKLRVALRNFAKAPRTANKVKCCNTESRLITAAGGITGSSLRIKSCSGPTHCLSHGQKISYSCARYEEPTYRSRLSEAQHKILMSVQMRYWRKKRYNNRIGGLVDHSRCRRFGIYI